jgi:hypothetical protein
MHHPSGCSALFCSSCSSLCCAFSFQRSGFTFFAARIDNGTKANTGVDFILRNTVNGFTLGEMLAVNARSCYIPSTGTVSATTVGSAPCLRCKKGRE